MPLSISFPCGDTLAPEILKRRIVKASSSLQPSSLASLTQRRSSWHTDVWMEFVYRWVEKASRRMVVIDMLTQSLFNADLSLDRNELAAMEFLLVGGCRTVDNGEALLRGGYLLQASTTESMSNCTTACAALQQLTTSVFNCVVLIRTICSPQKITFHHRITEM